MGDDKTERSEPRDLIARLRALPQANADPMVCEIAVQLTRGTSSTGDVLVRAVGAYSNEVLRLRKVAADALASHGLPTATLTLDEGLRILSAENARLTRERDAALAESERVADLYLSAQAEATRANADARNADIGWRAEREHRARLTRELAEVRALLAGGEEPTPEEIKAASTPYSYWMFTRGGFAYLVRFVCDEGEDGPCIEIDGGEWEPLAQGLATLRGGRWRYLVDGSPAVRPVVSAQETT